jgi:mannose/fructose/N-acetylgalactosamine-specific phosphotransferase system component IIC
MGFKLVLNVFYTMGVALCFIVAFKMATTHNYPIMAGAIIVGVVVIFMKLRLLKEVKETQEAPQNKKGTGKK